MLRGEASRRQPAGRCPDHPLGSAGATAPSGSRALQCPASGSARLLAGLKERLTLGRVRFPRIPFETDATAYDASIAAAPTHLLVATNFKVALLETSLRAWATTVLPPEVDVVFDPRVLYDQHDGRWVLVASGVHYADFTSPLLLLPVSRTSDPRGDWWGRAVPETARTEIRFGGPIIRAREWSS